MKAKICLCLTGKTLKENLEFLGKYPQAEMAELRTDLLDRDQWEIVTAFSQSIQLPLILTCRKSCDGGQYSGDESERISWMKQWLDGRFDFIDLEEDLENDSELVSLAAEKRCRVIRSAHNFEGVPTDMARIVDGLARTGEELPKLAVAPQNINELLTFYKEAAKIQSRERIILAMGSIGLSSRILADRLGSYLTFTSPDNGTQAAPGQISPETLVETFRFTALKEKTTPCGIIGNPVMHSRSPRIHNTWFSENGLDGIYIPFPVEDPADFMPLAEELGLSGFSVTIPHKQNIIPLLDDTDDAVKSIGACNTVYRKEGKWLGTNTDAEGFIIPLLEKLGRDNLKGIKTAVIGAGGAARAVLYALKQSGSEVLILNRTVEKARLLAKEFDCKAAALGEESLSLLKEYSEIIVQTSCVGMDEDKSPIPFYTFTGNELVYDIIYTPPVTRIMSDCSAAGGEVLGGMDMLKKQAERQFALFSKEIQRKL